MNLLDSGRPDYVHNIKAKTSISALAVLSKAWLKKHILADNLGRFSIIAALGKGVVNLKIQSKYKKSSLKIQEFYK